MTLEPKRWLSDDPTQEAFGTRALFLAGYGAADFGECAQAVQRAEPGGAGSWHYAWSGIADGLVDAGESSAAGGHRVSAREAYLRATTYYRIAYAPLFGSPLDPRLQAAFARAEEAFAKAAPLWDVPVELLEIPFEDGSLPAVFVAADGSAHPRLTIVHVNRRDARAVGGRRRACRARRLELRRVPGAACCRL